MTVKYGKRKGLQGPFYYPNGRVTYYDPKEEKYWDPATDFFLEDDEVDYLKGLLFEIIAK